MATLFVMTMVLERCSKAVDDLGQNINSKMIQTKFDGSPQDIKIGTEHYWIKDKLY